MNVKYKDFQIDNITIDELAQLLKLMDDSQMNVKITYVPYTQPYTEPYAPWYPTWDKTTAPPSSWFDLTCVQDYINIPAGTTITAWNKTN